MKKSLLLLAFLIVSIYQTDASTIVLSASAAGRAVFDSSSVTPMPNGNIIQIGHFSSPNSLSLSQTSVQAILTAGGWSQFGGNLLTSSIFATSGKVKGTDTDDSAAATSFNNQSVYVMVFNAPTTLGATQLGIFRATAGTPVWTFPTNGFGFGDSVTLNMDDITLTSVNGVGSVVGTVMRTAAFASAPEPTSATLLMIGLVSLASRRRRQGK